MNATAARLYCLQGFQPDGNAIQEDTQTVDLQRPTSFVAFVTLGYFGGRGSGPWDFDNAFAAEVYQVDGAIVGVDAWQGRFGAPGAFTNLHQTVYRGYGQRITFRLRIFQPEEMEAHADGVVLFDL